MKRWMAHYQEPEAGIVINAGAEEALCSEDRVTSLLPIGIVRLEGQFKKGDIVKILNEKKETLALGRTQYGSEGAKRQIGQRGGKPLIHYDYLLLLR